MLFNILHVLIKKRMVSYAAPRKNRENVFFSVRFRVTRASVVAQTRQ